MNLLGNLWRNGRSRSPSRSTRRPGRARRRPLMEELETRMVPTLLTGTQYADLIEVRRDTSNPAALRVTISQGINVSTDVILASFTSNMLEIDAGDGLDTFKV